MLTDEEIETLVARYGRERDRFEKMAATVARHLGASLFASAIPHLMTFRSKNPRSLRGKLRRDRCDHELVAFTEDFSPSVLDLAAVRVLLYRPSDVDTVCRLVEERFVLLPGDRYRRDYARVRGYRARHRITQLTESQLASDPSYANLAGTVCEVQIATLTDHAWNELEHDILYKTPAGTPSELERDLLAALRAQLDAVDETMRLLTQVTSRGRAERLAGIDTPVDLRAVLEARLGRPVSGDLARLKELLEAALVDLSPASLASLPLEPASLDAARDRLVRVGLGPTSDDTVLIVAALWPTHREALERALGERREGPLRRVVQRLDAGAEPGGSD